MKNLYERLASLTRENPFYQNSNYRNTDILTWPIIDKLEIIQNYDKFINNVNKKECIKCSTTGSTGLILDTFWRPKDYYYSLLNMWRIRKNYGIYPHSTYCTCHSNAYLYDNLLKHKIIIDRNQISFSKLVTDDKILNNYIRTMFEYNVHWFLLQPSLLLKIILCAEKNQLNLPQVQYIECTGEKLSKETKDYILQKFQNSIIIDSYGMQEFNTIGYNLGNGFNILSNNVYVEIINNNRRCDEGEIGDIVVSGLCNTLMPYIRYKT